MYGCRYAETRKRQQTKGYRPKCCRKECNEGSKALVVDHCLIRNFLNIKILTKDRNITPILNREFFEKFEWRETSEIRDSFPSTRAGFPGNIILNSSAVCKLHVRARIPSKACVVLRSARHGRRVSRKKTFTVQKWNTKQIKRSSRACFAAWNKIW